MANMQPTAPISPTAVLTPQQISAARQSLTAAPSTNTNQSGSFDWSTIPGTAEYSANPNNNEAINNPITKLGQAGENLGTSAVAVGGGNFANDVGQTIAANIFNKTNPGAFDQLPKIDQTNVSNLFTMMHTAVTSGNTALATHFADAIKNYQYANGTTLADAFPVLNKTPEQIVGDAIGAATTAATLGAGSLLDAAGVGGAASEEAIAAAKAAGTEIDAGSTVANASRGALVGATAGAGAGVGGAMGQNQSAQNVAKAGVEGTVTGAVLGGGTGALEESAGGSGAESESTPQNDNGNTNIQKDPQKILDATAPEEKGKTLVKAYENVAKNTRTGGESGFLKTQGLDPGTNAASLSSRLNDIPGYALDGNTHLDNLKALGANLTDTENKIGNITDNDTTTGTKEGLKGELENLKSNKPTEFKIKGDTTNAKNTYNAVIDFAKKVVDNNEESTGGFRNGRSSFDSQAQREFPSAFKDDGSIDTTKPGGSSIKAVRDTWNKYTYSNSSQGDELEAQIQREADIFRAAKNIAPKAAAADGEDVIDRFMDNHEHLKRGANLLERIGMRTVAGTAARGIVDAIKGAIGK